MGASAAGCKLLYYHKDYGMWKCLFNSVNRVLKDGWLMEDTDSLPTGCPYFQSEKNEKEFYKSILGDKFRLEK